MNAIIHQGQYHLPNAQYTYKPLSEVKPGDLINYSRSYWEGELKVQQSTLSERLFEHSQGDFIQRYESFLFHTLGAADAATIDNYFQFKECFQR